MIENLADALGALLLLAGGAACLIGAFGVWRLPDPYMRLHAASKAGVFGCGLILVALAIAVDDAASTARALAAVGFILLTAPIAAHVIARAACRARVPLWSGSVLDQMPPADPPPEHPPDRAQR